MLTAFEKVAGRAFKKSSQEALDWLCADEPTLFQPPYFQVGFRHLCPKRNSVSTILELKEKYELSPAYVVCTKEDGSVSAHLSSDPAAACTSAEHVPAGRFAFIFKVGRCPRCGQTARSPVGKLVDAYVRRPVREGALR